MDFLSGTSSAALRPLPRHLPGHPGL